MADTGLHVEFNPSGINLSTGGCAAQRCLIITELMYWKGRGSVLAGLDVYLLLLLLLFYYYYFFLSCEAHTHGIWRFLG